MEPVRSALYLDFDNVFSGLLKLDPAGAVEFAEAPQRWLHRLAGQPGRPASRWLVLRCYMNPGGSVAHPQDEGSRLYFSRFRSAFTDAGFEVVDCPRLSHTKNGADIRLVIDAVEALQAEARYDEFVIASGDSDMTPLLVRLRAADRRVTLISPSDSAVVMRAVADRLIGGEDLLDLLDTREDVLEAARTEEADAMAINGLDDADVLDPLAEDRFATLVRARYQEASDPINLASLAHEVRAELGSVGTASRWFGHGSFARAVRSVDLPGGRVASQHLWDENRHQPPRVVDDEAAPAPGAVARVAEALKLPILPTESWTGIYQSLADFVETHEFNLSEMARWVRDRLAEADLRGNRQVASLVAHGAAYGGCPLYRQPPPTADEVAAAFVSNVLNRAAASNVALTDEETVVVRRWLGAPATT